MALLSARPNTRQLENGFVFSDGVTQEYEGKHCVLDHIITPPLPCFIVIVGGLSFLCFYTKKGGFFSNIK